MSAQDQINQNEASINSYGAKTGNVRQSDSTLESGVNENVTSQFPGATVQVGGTGRGENPPIPDEEGGGLNPATGHQTKASDFEGAGGPEEKQEQTAYERPGDQNVINFKEQGQ
ncbi:hypothetical protein IAR50_003859 [Cryptococcus sp. DSM 104548]